MAFPDGLVIAGFDCMHPLFFPEDGVSKLSGRHLVRAWSVVLGDVLSSLKGIFSESFFHIGDRIVF